MVCGSGVCVMVDDAWTETIMAIIRLKEPSGAVWPSTECVIYAERLALRLSSANLLAPDSVSAVDDAVVLTWKLEDTTREVVINGDNLVTFRVTRKDGAVSFEMRVPAFGRLESVLYAWLDSWINCVS